MSFTIEQYNAQDHYWRELPEIPPLDIAEMIALARKLSEQSRTLRVIDWPMGAVHAGFPWRVEKLVGFPGSMVAIWVAILEVVPPALETVYARGETEAECIANAVLRDGKLVAFGRAI
jgi:hypothetical protein